MYGISEEKIKKRYALLRPDELKVSVDGQEYMFHSKIKVRNTIKFEKAENGKMYFQKGDNWVPADDIKSKYRISVMFGSMEARDCAVEIK